MDALRERYEQHADGTAGELCDAVKNGLREHLDRFAEVCKVVRELRPGSILDAPCGLGMLTSLVSLHGGPTRVVGIDIAEGNVQMARAIWGVTAEQADLLTYQPAELFELVMCMELLEHVQDPHRYVEAALRCSEKYVLFSVPIEAQPVDGEFHVAKIHPTALWDWITEAGADVTRLWVLPSVFCEKPKWLGWLYALAEVR